MATKKRVVAPALLPVLMMFGGCAEVPPVDTQCNDLADILVLAPLSVAELSKCGIVLGDGEEMQRKSIQFGGIEFKLMTEGNGPSFEFVEIRPAAPLQEALTEDLESRMLSYFGSADSVGTMHVAPGNPQLVTVEDWIVATDKNVSLHVDSAGRLIAAYITRRE